VRFGELSSVSKKDGRLEGYAKDDAQRKLKGLNGAVRWEYMLCETSHCLFYIPKATVEHFGVEL
jgi:hypothetical protein